MTAVRLTDFSVLTFDCYGTLIDWESGIAAALAPLLTGRTIARDQLLEAFARVESAAEAATPGMRYSELLAVVHGRLAAELGLATTPAMDATFGASIKDWPAFPDSSEALAYLKRHYRLVILSNVDRAGFAASNRRLGVAFDAVYTAEDIGSYKPDARNFDYLIRRVKADLGLDRDAILHTAQSLFHDHVPAKAAGLATAWIDRRHDRAGFGATMPPPVPVTTDFRFDSMAAMARAHGEETGPLGQTP